MNKTIATSFTATLFLVIGISGVMMFFHFYDNQVKSLHEYLGLAFIVAVLLHIFYNWKSMKNYFSKKSFIIIAVTTLLVSNVFILQSLNQKQSPKGKIIKSVLQAPLKDSYTILNIINAKEKLEKEGFEVVEASTLQELAKLNGKNPFEIISILTK